MLDYEDLIAVVPVCRDEQIKEKKKLQQDEKERQKVLDAQIEALRKKELAAQEVQLSCHVSAQVDPV